MKGKFTMNKFLAYFLYTLLLGATLYACNDDLDIQQVYPFDLVTMPVQKKIVQGETSEIRCEIIREGEYSRASYAIRFFQTDGKGELRLDDGRILLPNDLYPLDRMVFRMYYKSLCADQQNIDIYIVDNAGQVVQKSFSWQNDSGDDQNKEDEK